jgi:hypothetical protein
LLKKIFQGKRNESKKVEEKKAEEKKPENITVPEKPASSQNFNKKE